MLSIAGQENTFAQHLKNVKRAYEVKQHCFKQSEIGLRKQFGDALILDTIDDRTKRAWRNQWQPQIAINHAKYVQQKEPAEERYLENTFFNKPPLHYFVPPNGFQDDFNMAANIAYAGHFFPKRFDLSIWFNDILCGVAFSALETKPSNGAVLIDLREGHPDRDHPLKSKIALIINEVSKNYAKALDYKKIAYRPPYSKGAKKLHERMNLKLETVMIPSSSIENHSEQCFVQHI